MYTISIVESSLALSRAISMELINIKGTQYQRTTMKMSERHNVGGWTGIYIILFDIKNTQEKNPMMTWQFLLSTDIWDNCQKVMSTLTHS